MSFVLALERINEFERAISIRLYNLITLQFTLHFPIDHEHYKEKPYSSEDYVYLQNDTWQSRGWLVRDYIDVENKCFMIYTVPYTLSSDRSLCNYTFIAAQQPEFVNMKASEILFWECTYFKPSASKIAQCLNGFRKAKHLLWVFKPRVRFFLFP